MKTAWYEDWFNTDEYLEVYRHRNYGEAEQLLNLILSNTLLQNGVSVLDMACGAGRHSIVFAKKGFDVTAVDLSDRLLDEADKNAAEAKVSINFIKSDVRDFQSEKLFDVVLNLFTSFGYFESDEENFNVFKKAFNLLKKNGYFILDYFNKNYLIKNLVPKTTLISGDKNIIQERSIEQNRIIKKIKIKQNGNVKNYLESVRLYGYDEIAEELKSTGFKIVNVFGDFYGSEFDNKNSERTIIIAKK